MTGPTDGRDRPSAATRNVVVVGPQGAGKTTLVEALVHACGATTRLGRVSEGTTVSDHTDVEKKRRYSVHLAVATIPVTDPEVTAATGPIRLTLVDTPDHPDFIGDVRAGLRAGDAALFVISAVDGVDPGAAMLWRECAAASMPRAIVMTHLDHERADVDAALASCQAVFGDGVHPLYLPHCDGIVALLSGTIRNGTDLRDATPEELATVEAARADVVEAIITESESEGLLERYLGGEEIDFDTIVDDLLKAVVTARFFPVIPIRLVEGTGAGEVLEIIVRGFPAPADRPLPTVYGSRGEELPTPELTPDGPLLGQVIKTTTDAYVGRISVVRIFGGTVTPDSPVHISGHLAQFTRDEADAVWHPDHDTEARTGSISELLGATLTPLPRAEAGDIVAIAHLEGAETGDTISGPDLPMVIAPWDIARPYLPTAVRAPSSKDEDKLMRGLGRTQAENPSVRLVVDSRTGQLVLWTMGEQQLEILLGDLRERDGIEVETEPMRVAMHETVLRSAEGVGRHVKQSGGHGQYAIANITIEPLGTDEGFEFVDEVVGGAVPRQFIPSVEKGVRTQLEHGVTGHPMVDVRVRLTGGKAHSVDSSDAAFQMAGALALREAATAAGIQLLEPIDEVEIVVDDEFVGAVMSDLASRRGRVRGTDADDAGRTRIDAEVPAVELLSYTQMLRSLARGSGDFTRRMSHYAPAPRAD